MYKKQWGLYTGVLLIILLFFAVPLRSEAAWVRNTDGTYSYYKNNGKKAVSTWINNKYYVDADGIRQTGWLTLKKKTYFLDKSTGRKLTKTWVRASGEFYYFNANGVMVKNKKVGQYYVGPDGKRLSNTWVDGNIYLDSNGKSVKGLQMIDGKYYYFNNSTGKKTVLDKVTVDGILYEFDKDGVGVIVSDGKIPAAKVSVEDTYYSDPCVSDETLLGAIIYCEAGNQPYYGQLAVGMVIMNRMYSSSFPGQTTVREVVYAKTQFQPARNNTLTNALENPLVVTDACRKAAKETLKLYKNYTPGKKIYLTLQDQEKVEFSEYYFFMTYPSYVRLGLKSEYSKIGDHVFFKTWKR